MASTTGEKEIKRDWPHEEGLIARTTKQEGTASYDKPEVSLVPDRLKVGL